MTDLSRLDLARRDFLLRALAAGALTTLPGLAHGAVVREVSGKVWVDGVRATGETVVKPGAMVESARGARFAFVVAKDAFLMRERTRVQFGSVDNAVVHSVRVLAGALMAVFGGGEHRIHSAQVTAGVRGTGVYVETAPDSTYFCLCYGEGSAALTGAPEAAIELGSQIHNAYRFRDGRGAPAARISRAGLENHTDAELYMLEKFVGRTPPFALGSYGGSYSDPVADDR